MTTLAELRKRAEAMRCQNYGYGWKCNPKHLNCHDRPDCPRAALLEAVAGVEQQEQAEQATLKTILFLIERNQAAAMEMVKTLLTDPAQEDEG